MPELNAANIEQVIQACQANVGLMGQSLNQCLGTAVQLSLGESLPASGLDDIADLNGPGLVIGFEVGATSMLCVISASLPIPNWSWHPDPSQASRLETLAQEWSLHCLPEELTGENFVAQAVPCLKDYIVSAHPDTAAECQAVLAAAPGEVPASRIWLIWPVLQVPSGVSAAESGPVSSDGTAYCDSVTADRPAQSLNPYIRLRNLPVPVIVKLAEKKIELGQLLAIGPGAIITFEKSCEDLLELYVNNHLYCRGEAVKIGEKFGIKICETGSVHSRASALAATETRSA